MDYNILRVFGCLCFSTDANPKKDKFKARAIKCIFLGYSPRNKVYKVFEYNTNKLILSRDVIFHEQKFLFDGQEKGNSENSIPLPLVNDEEIDHVEEDVDDEPTDTVTNDVTVQN